MDFLNFSVIWKQQLKLGFLQASSNETRVVEQVRVLSEFVKINKCQIYYINFELCGV